ncbi:hypothetical protein HDU76_001023, partial [Blyttiomyces sp. JEL0837]
MPTSPGINRASVGLPRQTSFARDRDHNQSSSNPPSVRDLPSGAGGMAKGETQSIRKETTVGSRSQSSSTGTRERDETQSEFFKHRTLASQAVDTAFSVLFFMAHGNKANLILEYVALIVEDLQLMTFFLSFEIGHPYFLPGALPTIATTNYGGQDIGTYGVTFGLCAGAVILMALNIAFVAYGVLVIVSSLSCNLIEEDGSGIAGTSGTLAVSLIQIQQLKPRRPKRAGLYSAAVCVGIVSVGASVTYSATGQERGIETVIIIAIFAISGLVSGFILTKKWIQTIQNGCIKRLREQDSKANETEEFLVFQFWTHVEITARVITAKMTERKRKFDKSMLPLMHMIFKRGIEEFADEPFVMLSRACYGHHLENDSAQVLSIISKLKTSSPPLDVRFQIYFADQIANHSREVDFHELNTKLDVSSYAEFQKTNLDAHLNHYLAVQELRNMWKLILDKAYSLEELSRINGRLSIHAQKAQAAYLQLAAKYPKSKIILRYFSRFCYDVTHDVVRGDNLRNYANELEDLEAQIVRNEITDGMITNNPLTTSNPLKMDVQAPPEVFINIDQENSLVVPRKIDVGPSTSNDSVLGVTDNEEASEHAGSETGRNAATSWTKDLHVGIEKTSIERSPSQSPSRHTDLEKRRSFIKIRRGPASAASGTSQESSQNTVMRRAQISLQKQREDQLNRRALTVKSMFALKTVCLVALVIANFVVVTSLLRVYSQSMDLLDKHARRSKYTALETRRMRQFQSEVNPIVFKELQDRLAGEMDDFVNADNGIFYNRDDLDPNESYFMNNANIPVVVRNYPVDDGITVVNVSLYSLTERLLYCGIRISNETMSTIKQGRSNDMAFRSVMFVKIFFVILVDAVFHRFSKRLQNTLEIFRFIPKDVIKDAISDMDEVDSTEIFPAAVIKHAESYKEGDKTWSPRALRVFLWITASVMTVLAGSFAYINSTSVNKIGENLIVMSESARMAELGIRNYNDAYELWLKFNRDPNAAFMNTSMLQSIYLNDIQEITSVMNAILFGDNSRNPAAPGTN